MTPEINEIRMRRIEMSLSRIGGKVADAMELSQQAQELSAHAVALLISAQQELEELYVSIFE